MVEFTNSADCIFRLQQTISAEEIRLADGITISPGAHIASLHLWNEHLPVFRNNGPTLGWARQMSRALDTSLRELACFFERHSEFDDVVAISANMGFGTGEQADQLAHIAAHYGFQRIALPAPRSLADRVHRFGENILISMIVMTKNPSALRAGSLRRDRVRVVMSRCELDRRYRSRGSQARPREERPARYGRATSSQRGAFAAERALARKFNRCDRVAAREKIRTDSSAWPNCCTWICIWIY